VHLGIVFAPPQGGAHPLVLLKSHENARYPWHRKKRLAKKWRKQRGPRYLYDKVDVREILHDLRRGILYCYPPMLDALRRMLQE